MTAATVLYSENNYPDDSVERRIYGSDIRVILPKASKSLADLSDEHCREAEGLMILRFKVGADDLNDRGRRPCDGSGFGPAARIASASRDPTC
jgi:hypothetical protein